MEGARSENAPEYVDPRQLCRVLVALRELREAEVETAGMLEADPRDLDAWGLLSKIKHIRGELSEAVACWAQIQARSPYAPVARLHLGALFDMARDPERGAGQFVAIGQYQMGANPMASMELIEAFRAFVSGPPDAARAVVQRIAVRHRGHDHSTYKLAVMAEAWIDERSGDLPGACRVLERLGRERGFENDFDRISALADLYERIGTPERLEAAVNICRFLESSYADLPVLGRLAVLFRKLGRVETAERYELRHVAAFRRGMQRPSFDEVVAVAARRYLPIAHLRQIPLPGTEARRDASRREAAVAAALRGADAAALDLFEKRHTLIDRKYRAEILRSHPDDSEAALAYADILHDDPGDLHVARLLLGGAVRPHWVDRVVCEPGIGDRLYDTLRAAAEADPNDARLWRALAHLAEARGDSEEDRHRWAARATAREAAERERACPVGRVLAAAVYHIVGQPKGLIHEVWAAREAAEPGKGGRLPSDHILGNVTDDMRAAVRSTFVAVREFARARFPHRMAEFADYDYTFKITKDDEPSSGTSAGLPTALAFLSAFTRVPVRQDAAFTGAIVTEAHDVLLVRHVGDVEYKVKGAFHRDLAALVIPEENRSELERSNLVPAAIRADMCKPVGRFEDAVRFAFGEDLLK